jgi:superfamily I DNA and/or RNA helicase
VAVLTPYDAQVGVLRGLLATEVESGLEVGSIDSFQGREKEAIVLDLVRQNDDAEIGFLRDIRRMNVALTRARRFLILVGDSATLGQTGFYAKYLADVELRGAWVSVFSDPAEIF